jgi:large subunit ribosomal protein L3
MAAGLIGRKIGMTQVFDEKGMMVPVTVIQAGPCLVVQRKTSAVTERERVIRLKDGKEAKVRVKKTEGYDAVKLGFLDIEKKRIGKQLRGQFSPEWNVRPQKILKEFRIDAGEEIPAAGEFMTVAIFEDGEFVDVSGKSRGLGFQGVMRRHNFSGGPKTHGSHSVRAPGSIGQCAWPSKVFRGKKMPGKTGDDKVTMQNLQIVKIDSEKNLLLVKGSIPGARNGIVYIRKSLKKRGRNA